MLEALLVGGDLGIRTVTALMSDLETDIEGGDVINEETMMGLLKMKLLTILEANAPREPRIESRRLPEGPRIIVIVGVNGVGKTTTVAKLGSQLKDEGSKVLLVAADTFRAAAVEQLKQWGNTIGAPVISGADEAKPGTVVFDAMKEAAEGNYDVVIIDTAGRLHTKSNLMQELEGVRNVIQRHRPDAPHETLLVVDGSTGQNAVSQAREFHAAVPLTGLVVTKLDGTAKGGVLVAIKEELGIPVRYIGVGESKEDLRPFNAREFVDALFAGDTEEPKEVQSAHGEERRRRRRQDTIV